MNSPLDHPSRTRNTGTMPSCETAVECLAVDCGGLPATAAVTRFRGAGGVTESHITVQLTGHGAMAPLEILTEAYRLALHDLGLDSKSAVFRRVFCSDVANQGETLKHAFDGFGGSCAVSIIGQAPLPAAKFALWAYHVSDPERPLEKSMEGATLGLRRGPLTHYWTPGLIDCGEDEAHSQTREILENYDAWLDERSLRMADHVIRTWWFVQNIDADYVGLVKARGDFFATHGLTADTHYLASTGIAGSHSNTAARVILDSYAIGGLLADQVRYLCAPGHLCPTHDYGVTFERATAVDYADRRHIFVSGTASIDHTGDILHEGDVLAQLDRTLENIDALLAQADANSGDLAVILVYLRDPADAAVIGKALRDKLGSVPHVMVDAPVCRPGWLIEIEGIAVVTTRKPRLPAF